MFGKVEFDSYSRGIAMMHPEYEILSDDEDGDSSLHTGRVVPVYEAAGKVNTRVFRTLIHRILENLPPQADPLPPHILQQTEAAGSLDALSASCIFRRRIRTCGC